MLSIVYINVGTNVMRMTYSQYRPKAMPNEQLVRDCV